MARHKKPAAAETKTAAQPQAPIPQAGQNTEEGEDHVDNFVQQQRAARRARQNFSDDANEDFDDQSHRKPSPPRRHEDQAHERSPLHQGKSDSVQIEGINFRRVRGTLDQTHRKTLDIDPKLLNPLLHYRWVNDEKGLVEQRREIGYETIPSLKSKRGEEISTRRRVGTQKDGSPLYAVLMATLKENHLEREQVAEAARRQAERAIVSGKQDGQEALSKGEFYVKDETKIQP